MTPDSRIPRRDLLKSVLALPLTAALPSASASAAAAAPSVPAPLTLAGRTPAGLLALYESELAAELDFWEKHGIDHEFGGIMCSMDHDGTLVNTDKRMWYQGRGLWVYSFLYNHLGKNPRHLEIARGIKEFMFKHGRGEPYIFHENLARDGKVLAEFDGRLYTLTFAALGLQEYAQATGDEEAMEWALGSFMQAMELYERPDYGSTFKETPDYPPGTRVQGVAMVTVDTLTQMVEVNSDRRLHEHLDRAVDAVMNKFHNPEFALQNEALQHDFSRYPREIEWFWYVWLGHSIETFWMILHEAMRRGAAPRFQVVAARLHRHLEVAWDDVYGGLGIGHQIDTGAFNYSKRAYVQEEAMIGLMTVIERLGAPAWAVEWYDRIHEFAFTRMPVPGGYPGWHSSMERDAKPIPHVTRRENFHHPRFLMHNILTLRRMTGTA